MAQTTQPTKEELVKKLGSQSKDDLLEALGSKLTKDEITSVLGSKLKKEELAAIAEADDDQTKEQLLRKLATRAKDELVSAIGTKLTKNDLVSVLSSKLKLDDLRSMIGSDEDEGEQEDEDDNSQKRQRADDRQRQQQRDDDGDTDDADGDGDGDTEQERGSRAVVKRDESTDIDWSAELDWAPPPDPTPAPVTFSGAAPGQPGQRVRVDISGLPMMGVFAGPRSTAAGTITGVDARSRMVTVYLDAVMDGKKEIVVPPERLTAEG